MRGRGKPVAVRPGQSRYGKGRPMDAHAETDWDTIERSSPEPEAACLATKPPGAGSDRGGRYDVSAVASSILDDVRRAMERNRPEGARLAALRLVSLFDEIKSDRRAWGAGAMAAAKDRSIPEGAPGAAGAARGTGGADRSERQSLLPRFQGDVRRYAAHTPHPAEAGAGAELMLTTGESLSQVALASGFADQAHLSKLFGASSAKPRARGGAETSANRRRRPGESHRHGAGSAGAPGLSPVRPDCLKPSASRGILFEQPGDQRRVEIGANPHDHATLEEHNPAIVGYRTAYRLGRRERPQLDHRLVVLDDEMQPGALRKHFRQLGEGGGDEIALLR